MGITISNARIQTFERNVIHLAQQNQSRLRDRCMFRGPKSEKHNWDRIGLLEASEKTAARTATPEGDAAWSRRTGVNKTWHAGDTVEKEDINQMLIEPKSSLAVALARGMNRKIDDIIIDAADGTVATLDGDGNTVAFPAGQVLGTAGSAVPISFDIITAAQELFMQNEVMPEVPKCMVVGPTQVRKLMQLTEHTSSDYVQAQALQQYGMVPNWLGFTWIVSNRLNSANTGEVTCLAFTNEGIGLQMSEDINTEVAKDPSRSFMWRVYCRMMAYAVRVQDEHIIKLAIKDSLT